MSTQKEQHAFTSANEQPHENLFSWRASAAEAKSRRGFTLIELMVAVGIFAIVMMVGVGALLSLVQINKRAQAINSVMNNVNSAIETMSRSIRVGTSYYCGSSISPPSPQAPAPTRDCAITGGPLLSFEPAGGSANNANDQVVFRLNGTQLERSLDSGATWVALTAPEVAIDSFTFYVTGSTRADAIQPRVLMRIKGSAVLPGGTTSFTVQASVVQRLIDF